MSDITKHYSEHEWESDKSKQSRVSLLIPGDSVSVDDLLGGGCELVRLEVGRWAHIFVKLGFCDLAIVLVRVFSVKVLENLCNFEHLLFGNPAVPLEHRAIHLQHIHGMVDRFFLRYGHFQLFDIGVLNSVLAWLSKGSQEVLDMRLSLDYEILALLGALVEFSHFSLILLVVFRVLESIHLE